MYFTEWKQVDGTYRKTCEHCGGKGYQEHSSWSRHSCYDHLEGVDHPANSERGAEQVHAGTGQILTLCRVCSRVWLVFYENSDDSLDIPGPEMVGDVIPLS